MCVRVFVFVRAPVGGVCVRECVREYVCVCVRVCVCERACARLWVGIRDMFYKGVKNEVHVCVQRCACVSKKQPKNGKLNRICT